MSTTTTNPSATTLPPDTKALDLLRLRLQQLSSSLTSLRRDLETADPLPTPAALQASAALIAHNLSGVTALLASRRGTLASARAYPLPSFPGTGQEALLGQLLRKKWEVGVAEWVEGAVDGNDRGDKEVEALWRWAGAKAGEVVESLPWRADFSVEERDQIGVENVRTGVRRRLFAAGREEEEEGSEDGDDEEEDEEDDEKMDVDAGEATAQSSLSLSQEANKQEAATATTPKPMMPLEDILRFATTGVVAGRRG